MPNSVPELRGRQRQRARPEVRAGSAGYCHPNGYGDPCCDVDLNSHCHTYPFGYAQGKRDGHANADAHPFGYADPHANRIAYSDTHAFCNVPAVTPDASAVDPEGRDPLIGEEPGFVGPLPVSSLRQIVV